MSNISQNSSFSALILNVSGITLLKYLIIPITKLCRGLKMLPKAKQLENPALNPNEGPFL